jgi:hypothetical protein
MFPKNLKEHSMDTRNNEVFRVQYPNTSRLLNSAIMYMQKLLNGDEQDKSKVKLLKKRLMLMVNFWVF